MVQKPFRIKTASPFFIGVRGRFEKVHVDSCIRCDLCAGFRSRYRDCHRDHVGCHSLYVGYTSSIQDIVSSTWSIIGRVGTTVDTVWACQV